MGMEQIFLWAFLSISLVINILYLISVYKESYRKSFEDPLTKLYNRKFLEDEVDKFVRFGKDKYEIIFCDIDHFKNVNDTYGHDIGDKVLEITGQKLKSSFKDGKDYIIRYGGEEFVILISKDKKGNKDIKDAVVERAESLRKSVENTVLNIDGQEIKFTMSFGICFYDENVDFKEQIKRADEALYYSKENGRNKITLRKDI